MINKIAVISDLHLDFWSRSTGRPLMSMIAEITGKVPPVDLLVIAGDICNGNTVRTVHADLMSGNDNTPVLFVPGNHDFYGYSLPETAEVWHNDQIAATTLWTNFKDAVTLSPQMIYNRIADSQYITDATAEKVTNLCNLSFDRLRKLDREIIVTHFPPSHFSTADRYKGDPLNPYFTNNFSADIVYQMSTRLWICGHVHHRHSYMLGDQCLVVCNPLGYPGETYRTIDEYTPMIVDRQPDGSWTTAG